MRKLSKRLRKQKVRLINLREDVLDLMETQLAVQIYIGLTEEEEQQLFGDINSKVQLVSKELGHSFDSIDPLKSGYSTGCGS